MQETRTHQLADWMPADPEDPVAEPLHEAFLERAASTTGGGSASGHALGAFLVLRVIDQFAQDGNWNAAALSYQVNATRDYLRHLQPQDAEVNHLLEIVRIATATAGTGNARLLWPPMLAYAFWLEQELRTFQALDVLNTVLRTSDGRDGEEETAALYQRGRVLRKLSRYRGALAAFGDSAEMSKRLGDRHSELSAIIGRGIVLEKLGNLPEAESLLGTVIVEALAIGDVEIEARARHDLANTLMMMERADEAVAMAYRAFELYERPLQRLRALSDLGMAFKMLEDYRAAEDAFAVVLAEEATTQEIRVNAMLELLDVAARTENRVSFERWRRALISVEATLAPDARIDFDLKLGAGFAAFDQHDRAIQVLRSAIARAEEHGLNAYLFQAESALRQLTESTAADAGQSAPVGTFPVGPEARRVAAHLHTLRGRLETT